MDKGAWWATNGPWGHKESDMAERLIQAHTEELLEVQH